MKIILPTYLATLVAFLVLDAFYLGGFAKSFFESQLSPGIMAAQPVLWAAALFYLMYAVGVLYFIVFPNAPRAQILRAALQGAGFGLVAYGTYDLTNMATINSWTVPLMITDMCWGTFATAVGSAVGTFTASRLMHRNGRRLV
jgi:uncharacterized membrane protein